MLPAIWFIFSRRDCDQAAVRCAEDGIVLTSPQEQASIQEEVRRGSLNEVLKRPHMLPVGARVAGIAARGGQGHDGGCPAGWTGQPPRWLPASMEDAG